MTCTGVAVFLGQITHSKFVVGDSVDLRVIVRGHIHPGRSSGPLDKSMGDLSPGNSALGVLSPQTCRSRLCFSETPVGKGLE